MNLRSVLVLSAVLFVCSCSVADRRTGVVNHWRKKAFQPFVQGTTKARVLDTLGPPSFASNLGDKTVLYYVSEHAFTWGLNLIIYRHEDTEVRFDRAMFVFDPDERLVKQAYSEERLPHPDEDEDEEGS